MKGGLFLEGKQRHKYADTASGTTASRLNALRMQLLFRAPYALPQYLGPSSRITTVGKDSSNPSVLFPDR